MDIDDMQQPGYMKQLQFQDVLRYAQKTKKKITEQMLSRHGFVPVEVNWLFHNKTNEIKQVNDMVTKTFLELERENKKLREYIQRLESTNKPKRTYRYVELEDEWLIKDGYDAQKKRYKSIYYLPKDYVVSMLEILDFLTTQEKPKTNYKQLAQTIITRNNLSISLDAFNGGTNRAKYLFPLYYYPLKILQHLGIIKYKAHGIVIRKRFKIKPEHIK